MRSPEEIDYEIEALRRLKPVGPIASLTAARLALAIEELQNGFDDMAEKWHELAEEERDSVMTARNWKLGVSDERPSEGWGFFFA